METPYTVLAAVLAVVEQALITAVRPVATSMVGLGTVAIDDCCAGLLVAAPERIFRTTTPFPADAGADAECSGYPIALDVLVLLARCVPVVTNRGTAPPLVDQEEASRGILADAAVIWRAMASRTILGDDGYGGTLWVRSGLNQVFVGAEGGCVYIETRMTVGVEQVDWCIEPLPGLA